MRAMMILMRNRLTQLLVAVVMALSMTTAAFAHRAPGGDEAALASFILAGGNLNDLCGEGHMGPGGSCPLCRIADDSALPVPPAAMPEIRFRFTSRLPVLGDRIVASGPARGLPVARGPPSI